MFVPNVPGDQETALNRLQWNYCCEPPSGCWDLNSSRAASVLHHLEPQEILTLNVSWPQTYCVADVGLELLTFLSLSLESLDFRHVPLCPSVTLILVAHDLRSTQASIALRELSSGSVVLRVTLGAFL